jgi:hypothetical protein
MLIQQTHSRKISSYPPANNSKIRVLHLLLSTRKTCLAETKSNNRIQLNFRKSQFEPTGHKIITTQVSHISNHYKNRLWQIQKAQTSAAKGYTYHTSMSSQFASIGSMLATVSGLSPRIT